MTPAHIAALSVDSALARRNHSPGGGPDSVAAQLARAEERLGIGAGGMNAKAKAKRSSARPEPARSAPTAPAEHASPAAPDGIIIRRATLADVPAIAGVMADYVIDGTLLPRPVGELYQCVREFHVAEARGEIVACAALRVLWDDLGEVRSLAVLPNHHGRGLGQALVTAVLDDARTLALPRVIALTREQPFF